MKYDFTKKQLDALNEDRTWDDRFNDWLQDLKGWQLAILVWVVLLLLSAVASLGD